MLTSRQDVELNLLKVKGPEKFCDCRDSLSLGGFQKSRYEPFDGDKRILMFDQLNF